MKITYEDSKKVDFGSLKPGEVFLHNNEDICMKIEKIIGNDGFAYNAIYIDNGDETYVDYAVPVELVDYEFKIIRR